MDNSASKILHDQHAEQLSESATKASSLGREVSTLWDAISNISLIFSKSQKKVIGISKRLNERAWCAEQVIESALRFLSNGGQLYLMVEDILDWKSLAQSNFIKKIWEQSSTFNLYIKLAPRGIEFNMLSGDGMLARWEDDPNKIMGFFVDATCASSNQAQKLDQISEWEDKFYKEWHIAEYLRGYPRRNKPIPFAIKREEPYYRITVNSFAPFHLLEKNENELIERAIVCLSKQYKRKYFSEFAFEISDERHHPLSDGSFILRFDQNP